MNLSKRDLTLKKERGNHIQLDIMVVCMGVVGTMGAASMVRSHILFPFLKLEESIHKMKEAVPFISTYMCTFIHAGDIELNSMR